MITRGVRRQNEARREFLREPRDGLIVFGNACNSVANAEKFFVRLATVLQTPESFSGHLQRSCKGPFSHFGVCRTSARALFSILAFAELLQTPKSFSRHLQRCCKHFQKLCAAFSALSKTFFRDTDPHSFAELAFGMCFVQIFCIVRSMYAHCEGVQIDIPSIFAPNKRDFT